MSDGPRASNDVNCLDALAEGELSAFFHAVDQLFGAEQARRSVLDWIDEMEAMSCRSTDHRLVALAQGRQHAGNGFS